MEHDPVETVRTRLETEASGGDVSLARYLYIVGEVADECGRDHETFLEEVRVALGGSFAIHAAPAQVR